MLKGVGAAFCSKTAPFLSCAANKKSPTTEGACVNPKPKAVEATFCSKTGPFFSCGSNKLCPNPI